jgi:hypothetical protein
VTGLSLLAWVESTALSQWVVGSLFAFPVILTLHAVGMGFAAGLSAMLDLRILGAARGVPLVELRRFVPVLWLGFWVNVASGVLLLIGYPTKALTNPVFYLKLAFVAAGLVLVTRITRHAFAPDPGRGHAGPHVHAKAGHDENTASPLRRLAIASLVCWTGAIVAGRLLAYTYTHLTASDF